MKTKREIILETSKKYTSKNRSTVENSLYFGGEGCLYKDDEGYKCAVGRCLRDDSRLFHEGNNLPVTRFKEELESELKAEYRGHCNEFWAELQTLHDQGTHWDYKGISKKGEEYVEYLLDTWGINNP